MTRSFIFSVISSQLALLFTLFISLTQHSNQVNRINGGNVGKPRICCDFMFLQVQFSVLCCDNAVLMLRLGLGTKSTWIGLEKDHVLA